ncbi:hypothetical protein QVD17_05864 [Tagetes erecta]|uniref:Uncharacterized protein n=1 Tax=Tagetes erecta TaxID=13708 RepID=A0AAD8LCS6_TARER|nr:hypothetical protein QVD17_05864 [Tagetes erecta]
MINSTQNPFGYIVVKDNQDIPKEGTQEFKLLSHFDDSHVGLEVVSKSNAKALLAIMFRQGSQIITMINDDILNVENALKRTEITFKMIGDAAPLVLKIASKAEVSLHQSGVYGLHNLYQYAYGGQSGIPVTRVKKTLLSLKHNKRLEAQQEGSFFSDELSLLNSINFHNQKNFVPSDFTRNLMNRQFAFARPTISRLTDEILDYIAEVVERVLIDTAHEQLHSLLRIICKNLMHGVCVSFKKKIELIILEKGFVYACGDNYMLELNKIKNVAIDLDNKPQTINIEIPVEHLHNTYLSQVQAAFKEKQSIMIYWKFVVHRFSYQGLF